MADLTSSFPKNLSYSIKNLNSFSKQSIKVLSDRLSATAGPNDIIKFKLPPNSLVDMRTFSIFFDGSATITGGTAGSVAHFPRYSSSVIQQLNVYVNNVLISTINDYNLLYNGVADMSFGGENASKRFLENFDPSIYYGTPTNGTYISTLYSATSSTSTSDTTKPLCINNFLGVFNSSTPVWDTSDLGDVIIEIRLAPSSIIWASAGSGASGPLTGTFNYSLANIRATFSRISFNSSEYYELKSAKLLDSGLLIGFQDFYGIRGQLQTKTSSVSWNYNVNANSLDFILATFQRSDYGTNNYLQLLGAASGATSTTWDDNGQTVNAGFPKNPTFSEALALQSRLYSTNNSVIRNDGDFFNQVQYFQRKASTLKTGQFAINSVMIDPYPKPSEEIYNETLINLGMKNLDTGSSIHPGCLNLYQFLKYYFVHVCSLQNISGDGQFWRSGLNGNSASINVQYNCVFDGLSADQVYPIFFNALTKIINVSAGRVINVV